MHDRPYAGPVGVRRHRRPEAEPALQGKYVGSKNSEIYHVAGCKDVEQTKPENRVEYDEPAAGKRLHKRCPR
jgi:hypothetical protein